MNLRSNVNRIHSDLNSVYESVKIEEKSNRELGNFVELVINEGKKQLVVKIKKYELEKDVFGWNYLSNPDDISTVVERVSNLNNFILDVQDIFEKNRFDSDYLQKLD
jgi:hypothetical protein